MISLERYPGIESGFLIVKEDGQLNYAEINFFAMEFVPTLLDLAAGTY